MADEPATARQGPPARNLSGAAWLRRASSQDVLALLQNAGHAARFVGGCVRDGLLDPDLTESDLDITTTARPERVMSLAGQAGIRALPTGLAHGTVTLVLDRTFEVTTLRRDMRTDGRHAEVAFTDSFEADAARRDFTINAMSCDADGRLFDYFGGLEDLTAGKIRFVGSASARIAEDYLRILRFCRFFARFGQQAPDRELRSALAHNRHGLKRISGERLQKELAGTLTARGAVQAWAIAAETGIAEALFGDVGDIQCLAAIAPCDDWLVALAALLRGCADPLVIARRLKLSVSDRDYLARLFHDPLPPESMQPAELVHHLYRYGRRHAVGLLHLALAHGHDGLAALLESARTMPIPQLPIAGRDLLVLGVSPGPALGSLLRQLEREWLDSNGVLGRQALLRRAETLAKPARSP